MPLVPLQLPPGVYRNGTDMQAAGRWRDASLVRWADGTMRPVAGWEPRFDLNDAVPRGAHVWRDLNNNRYMAVGTWDKLYAIAQSGTITDITPAGLTTGNATATQNIGYGGGLYGSYAYGTPRPDVGSYTEATTWDLDNWGEELVACSSADGASASSPCRHIRAAMSNKQHPAATPSHSSSAATRITLAPPPHRPHTHACFN